jgi:hypothetical protein
MTAIPLPPAVIAVAVVATTIAAAATFALRIGDALAAPRPAAMPSSVPEGRWRPLSVGHSPYRVVARIPGCSTVSVGPVCR